MKTQPSSVVYAHSTRTCRLDTAGCPSNRLYTSRHARRRHHEWALSTSCLETASSCLLYRSLAALLTMRPQHGQRKANIIGIPARGRNTTHIVPITSSTQAVARGQATAQVTTRGLLPVFVHVYCKERLATSSGPQKQAAASHARTKQAIRTAVVPALAAMPNSSKTRSLETSPSRTSSMEKPSQSHESPMVQRWRNPPRFSAMTVTIGLLQSVPLKLTRTVPICSAAGPPDATAHRVDT
mmetsp:Transcript_41237/g.116696  ORF Transcript_41237/g.116696 Transcript_41237/m.116696 type:complete len:240 (-) Transcript_41237:741-1460(-)